MRKKSRLLILTAVLCVTSIVFYDPIERHFAAVQLLRGMANEDKKIAPIPGQPVTDLVLPSGEKIPARSFGPPPKDARLSIVLAHGIHYKGIDEPRLIRFARHLADQGCHVLTPELTDLADYRITGAGVDAIRASVAYLATTDEPVGLIGFSFAGGLSLIAAQDPSTAERLKYVASVGGYHDLSRSLRFLATNEVEGPTGSAPRKAHEYGLLVLLYGHLEHFNLGPDEALFSRALKAWLMEDRPRAREFAAQLITKEAKELFDKIEHQRLSEVSDKLLPLLTLRAQELAALSPKGHLSTIKTAVLLLHGAGDSVVPPEETLFAEAELNAFPHASHRALISPLLQHVGVNNPAGIGEKLALVHLMSGLL